MCFECEVFCYVHVTSDFFVHLLRDDVGCVASRLWTDRSGVRMLARKRGFSLLQYVQTGSGAHPSSSSVINEVLSPG
jgi:hypothetical protein